MDFMGPSVQQAKLTPLIARRANRPQSILSLTSRRNPHEGVLPFLSAPNALKVACSAARTFIRRPLGKLPKELNISSAAGPARIGLIAAIWAKFSNT
jgi:hypothetical protein